MQREVPSIAVVGLGYVGAVCAVCWAMKGLRVIGVDVDPIKVERMNRGVSPILEPGLEEETRRQVEAGRLRATASIGEALTECDIVMICVGTPSLRNGDLGLVFVDRVCRELGEAIAGRDRPVLVVVRSTVLPGTTRRVICPLLEQTSGKKVGEGFDLVMNPEFLREGTAMDDFFAPPKTVVGEYAPGQGDTLKQIYEEIGAPVITAALEAAEMVKYTDNTWHATKVAFGNEIGSLCDELGISGSEVMQIFCEDRKLNISPAYLRPGFAFGGSCLPKDVRALNYRARSLDLDLPLLRAVLPSNEQHIDRTFDRIQSAPGRRIGVFGMSFKAGTDDLRESPQLAIIERLLGKGYEVGVYDRNVAMSRLHGANRDFLLKRIPHVMDLIVVDFDALLEKSEIVVIGNQDPDFAEIPERIREGQILIDLTKTFVPAPGPIATVLPG